MVVDDATTILVGQLFLLRFLSLSQKCHSNLTYFLRRSHAAAANQPAINHSRSAAGCKLIGSKPRPRPQRAGSYASTCGPLCVRVPVAATLVGPLECSWPRVARRLESSGIVEIQGEREAKNPSSLARFYIVAQEFGSSSSHLCKINRWLLPASSRVALDVRAVFGAQGRAERERKSA